MKPELNRLAVGALLAVASPPLAAGSPASEDISESRRTALVRAVERVQPAVVSVHVTHREPVIYRDPFREFFFPGSPFSLRQGERERISGGSGIIVSKDGLVITNAHVIASNRRTRQAPLIEVSLIGGRTLEAEYVSADPFLDLAIIRVDAAELPVAPLGHSGDILVGEWAIAIGNPFDLGPTVTAGVVSAVERDFQETKGDYYYRDMIQTDAAINPGNSGGPLVNAAGEVIGVNSFIYTGSEYSTGSIGIGFAIPIDAAKRFLEEVQQFGKVRRPWTGILGVRDLTRPLVRYLDLPVSEGVLVTGVAVGSPAYEAGLERGDVIVNINGEAVEGADGAKEILRGLRVGDTSSLEVVRADSTYTVTFELEERRSLLQRWH